MWSLFPSVRVDTQISSANHLVREPQQCRYDPAFDSIYQLMTPVKGIFPGRLQQQGETYGAVYFHITVDSIALEIRYRETLNFCYWWIE